MRTLAGYLSHAIEDFPVDPRPIYEMVVVGNSTMRDLFFRQNVYSIGQNPYQSITEIEMAEGKRDDDQPDARPAGAACCRSIRRRASTALPIISGHVGADAAACMLAVDLAHEDRLVADHGHRHEHRADPRQSASHPRGVVPGRPGVRRRRDRLRHAGARRRDRRRRDCDDDGTFALGVIGDGPPEGICGSGSSTC